MNILLSVLLVLSLINLVALVAIGAFLVEFRSRVNGMFSGLVNVIEQLFGDLPEPSVEVHSKKTWDEKYEEELENRNRLMKQQTGLLDLPDNPELAWGAPPAPTKNAKEMSIKDIEGLTLDG